MKEGKSTNVEFESQKKYVESDNRRKELDYLVSKFQEKLSENPIVIYIQHRDNEKPEELGYNLDKIKNVRYDKSGTGGDMLVEFNDGHNYISVDKEKVSASLYLKAEADEYKITKDSYNDILTMMDELIKDSGYSEVEKTKMFEMVVKNFKDKILSDEALEK